MSAESKKLLIVDDDEVFCDVLSRAMAKRDFTVFKAHNINDAMVLARAEQPDHALIDLRLGQESGLQLVKQLVDEFTDIKIVLFTGYASISTAVEAIKLGATHYLTKPAEPDQIIAAFAQNEGDADIEPASQPMSVERMEWEHIQKVLSEHDGNVSASARALGMHRRTLQRKLNKFPRKR